MKTVEFDGTVDSNGQIAIPAELVNAWLWNGRRRARRNAEWRYRPDAVRGCLCSRGLSLRGINGYYSVTASLPE